MPPFNSPRMNAQARKGPGSLRRWSVNSCKTTRARALSPFWRTMVLLALCITPTTTRADVVVVANRTAQALPIEITDQGTETTWALELAPQESRPIFTDDKVAIAFAGGRGVQRYTLEPNSAYFLGHRPDRSIDLQRIGLGETPLTQLGRHLPGRAATTPVATIPVKILVDEEETTHRYLWEGKLRRRVEKASEILHRHAMVKFEVVAVDTWQSDDQTKQFQVSLGEFETKVDPTPAQLAIGFTSQYQVTQGRVHLGGTRGAMQSHILLREWSSHVSETERLELLVHELGHYLGAAHSPEPTSVMRPVLGDRKARKTTFTIQFDPVNTLVMSMVGEEIRRRRIARFDTMTAATRNRIQQIYDTLGETQQGDHSTHLLSQMAGPRQNDPLIAAVQSVLHPLTAAARANSQNATPITGDALLDHYIRVATTAARPLPEQHRTKALLIALGSSIGHPTQLQKLPALRPLLAKIDSPGDRAVRNTLLGKPTIQDRHDLAQHFVVAAMLVAISGTESAEKTMLAKEVLDAQTGSGFSFADLAANKAGILWAQRLLAGELSLDTQAQAFRAADYVPPVGDLPEGLSTVQFISQFGGYDDDRYHAQVLKIDMAIHDLPGFRAPRRQGDE